MTALERSLTLRAAQLRKPLLDSSLRSGTPRGDRAALPLVARSLLRAPLEMRPRVLCVDVDGETLYVGGRRIALDGRPPLWRIVLALVAAQAERRALSTAELFANGWPGESASHESSTNRVYVAVATLRRLGLRGVVVRGSGGYLLDAEVVGAACMCAAPQTM